MDVSGRAAAALAVGPVVAVGASLAGARAVAGAIIIAGSAETAVCAPGERASSGRAPRSR